MDLLAKSKTANIALYKVFAVGESSVQSSKAACIDCNGTNNRTCSQNNSVSKSRRRMYSSGPYSWVVTLDTFALQEMRQNHPACYA